ncbi:Poly(A)-specific ribonuclease PARN [Platanthera zijinensis]|uniref:Poly(A)-specific ribonuclease PARN n=1 Tax=Platanthera zijinensis TaxID=2320716 RepID=A0AAP0BL20_9ASPA
MLRPRKDPKATTGLNQLVQPPLSKWRPSGAEPTRFSPNRGRLAPLAGRPWSGLISVLHPFSKLLEGGNTRVADYESYKEICRSSMSKFLFADQAEATVIRRKSKIAPISLETSAPEHRISSKSDSEIRSGHLFSFEETLNPLCKNLPEDNQKLVTAAKKRESLLLRKESKHEKGATPLHETQQTAPPRNAAVALL